MFINIIQAIIAVVGGTKKNKLDVFDADPIFIKYINIVNAPKETIIICQLIDRINEDVKFIYEISKKKEAINKKNAAAKAW